MSKRILIIVVCLLIGLASVWSNGWITVRTSVLGARVAIDEWEETTMHVHELSFAVDEGLHMVIVGKEGYYPMVDTVFVHDGENQLVPVWLEPVTTKAQRQTTAFQRTSWDYQLQNGLFAWRWLGVGGGLGTGLNIHVSLLDVRYGLLVVEPCYWGVNLPLFDGITHVQRPWLVHPRDRRSPTNWYEMAIPQLGVQFYYTPMVGVVLPCSDHLGFLLSAAPQISWTQVKWSYTTGDLPTRYAYEFTQEAFPNSGFQFDPVWFSAKIGLLFSGNQSELLTYIRYQDGYFLGVEFRY